MRYRYKPYFVEIVEREPKEPFGQTSSTSLKGMLFIAATTMLFVFVMFFVWTLSW